MRGTRVDRYRSIAPPFRGPTETIRVETVCTNTRQSMQE